MTPLSGQGARLGVVEVDIASGLSSVSLGESTERGIRVRSGPAHTEECDMGFDCSCGAVSASRIRRLTPLEVERCFGFPDGYTALDGAKDSHRFKALGNSMAVPVVRWIGERIAQEERRAD